MATTIKKARKNIRITHLTLKTGSTLKNKMNTYVHRNVQCHSSGTVEEKIKADLSEISKSMNARIARHVLFVANVQKPKVIGSDRS